nr:MAG TPA: hypothetical protein [Caudoviricetes sp.]
MSQGKSSRNVLTKRDTVVIIKMYTKCKQKGVVRI